MWYLIQAAVKNVRINLDQLRIKRQIDSQLCDSIFAAYVQAWLYSNLSYADRKNFLVAADKVCTRYVLRLIVCAAHV